MDCFYCQVEQVRLKISPSIPLAVQQWDNLIAVNYAARAASVSRHSSAKDALKQCPSLRLVHVPTLNTHNPTLAGQQYDDLGESRVLDRRFHKASLQPYREASMKVFKVIKETLTDIVSSSGQLTDADSFFIFEKASVDEVFIDVSALVDLLLVRQFGIESGEGRGQGRWRSKLLETELINNENIEIESIDWSLSGIPAVEEGLLDTDLTSNSKIDQLNDLRIYLGAEISQRIRKAVWERLLYTMSGGIAHNKTLAKLASASNKPNKQTFVKKCHIESWMRVIPFRKIRFLGGKLGKMVQSTLESHRRDAMEEEGDEGDHFYEVEDEEEDNATTKKEVTAAELWSLTVNELKDRLGSMEAAQWVYQVIRGHDTSSVTPRMQSKSFMAAKNLRPPLRQLSELADWLLLLINELTGRLLEDFHLHTRWPQSITIYYSRPKEKTKSRVMELPYEADQLAEHCVQLSEICLKTIINSKDALFPCSRLALQVSRFKNLGIGSLGKRSLTLDSFLQEKASLKPPEQGENEKVVPTKRKPKGIVDYFKTRITESSNEDNLISCERCSRKLHPNKIEEHRDYHFAYDLQQEMDRDNIIN